MGKKKDKKGRKSKNNQLSAEKQFQTEIKNIIEKIILKTEEDDPDCPIRIKTGKSKNKFSYSDLQVFINEQTKDVNVHNRIRLEYGSKYGLSIHSKIGSFTTVTILLPDKPLQLEPYT
jgi:LytS/YehU family sensor histidine kinase